jgi:hypothetical protein
LPHEASGNGHAATQQGFVSDSFSAFAANLTGAIWPGGVMRPAESALVAEVFAGFRANLAALRMISD